jgi:imidazolonepropionase-like amidohydrolase
MKTNKLQTLVLALGLTLSTAALADSWLIRDVQVFDGEHMTGRHNVLVDQGKIVDADFRGATPAAAHVIDGAGRTLLPGLIDAHVHAYRFLDLPLLFGVTTQVDMFTGVQLVQDMTRKMQRGENHEQADLFSAGTLATAPGGHGTEYGMPIPTLTHPDQAQAWVDARLAEGSFFIKIVMESGYPGHPMNSLDLPTVKALIAAAHLRGKLAVVHISKFDDARAALEAGADGLVHLFPGKDINRAELDSFVALAKQKKAFIIPTFAVLESIAGVHPDDVLHDSAMLALLDREQLQILKSSYRPTPDAAILTAPKAVVAALYKAGVPLLAGTDAGNNGTQYGVSLHHELAALQQAGLSPEAALAAATSAPARAFGLGQRGRIAAGYKADLLLVDGDPSKDMAATRRIVEIWKDGDPVSSQRKAQQARVAEELKPRAQNALALPADGRIGLFSKERLASPFGLGWMPSNDGMMGGKSTVRLQVLDGEASAPAVLQVNADVTAGFPYPWAGVAFMPGAAPMQPVDLSNAKVLRFRVKGDGQSYNASIMAKGTSFPVNVAFIAGTEWREVSIPLADFKGIDVTQLTMLAFNAGPKVGQYQFQIADVRLLGQ